MGACRSQELRDIKITNFQERDSLVIITLPDTKTNVSQKFVINGVILDIQKKYQALGPPKTTSTDFFLQYRSGKCMDQAIGKHTIAAMPKAIATFLKLSKL